MKGGVNFAKLGGDAMGLNQEFHFMQAFLWALKISDYLSYQTEFLYSSQGGQNDNAESKIIYDYLTISFLPKFYPFKHGLSIVAGPQFGLLVNGVIKDSRGQIDVKSELETVDILIVFGINHEIIPNVELQARYNLGLSSTATSPPISDERFPNRVIQMGLGVKF